MLVREASQDTGEKGDVTDNISERPVIPEGVVKEPGTRHDVRPGLTGPGVIYVPHRQDAGLPLIRCMFTASS